MNYIHRLLLTLFFFISTSYAVGNPLVVGITSFSPPFIMHGGHSDVYGFDIEMMNSLCKILQRTCQFRVMRFDQLLPAVANNTVDAAVGAITITPERTNIVNFSIPYLLSYSRFLTKAPVTQPFSLSLLNNKTIGIESGSIFADQIKAMGIRDPIIEEYTRTEEMLEELDSGEVDFVLLDSQTTLYWDANSSGKFTKIGPAYMYGYGFGIASSPALVNDLNKAILQYQSSKDFKLNYDTYINQF